jgi:hypothetical protein
MITEVEIYFNWLKATNKISPTFLQFLTANGYLDYNGSFSFSERFTAILDGTSINGNTPQNAFICFQRYGLIPRSMLNWTIADASNFPNQVLMDTSYYNPAAITQQMIDLGAQFLTFIRQIGWGWPGGVGNGASNVPTQDLLLGLKTSPASIAVPVDINTWNNTNVVYTGGTKLQHCVCMYKIDTKNLFPFYTTDQYQPWLKQLQANYYISVAIIFFIILK